MDLSKVTLIELITLNKLIKPLDEQYKVIFSSDIGDIKKHVLLTNIFVNKAQKTFEVFGEKSTQDIKTISVDFLVLWYQEFLQSFEIVLNGKWWESVGLDKPELTHTSSIIFGQFIDAKMIVDAGNKQGQDKWQVIQYIISIFLLTKKQKYNDLYTYEEHPRFIKCGKHTLRTAIIVSKWWEALNNYINSNYTVFQETGDVRDNCDNIDEHMQRWGWVNFLKSVAKTKAFDIDGSGLNSIDCVRRTKASEVLVWASEEKEFNVATSRDIKATRD